MNGDLKENLTRRSIWLRLVFMIVLGFAFNVVELIIFAVVVFQFLASLFTGKPNDHLIRFGRNAARYLQQIIAYLTFVTENKPFPFAPWPDQPHEEAPADEEIKQLTGEPEKIRNSADNDEAGETPIVDDAPATEDEEPAEKPKD